MSTPVSIDDTSPDIYYTGSWITGGASAEFNNTSHGTTTEGSQAVYSFNGSLIEVFGTIGLENGSASFAATSSYTIDGNSNNTVEFTGKVGTSVLYQQLFFSSQGLAEGQHTLVVSYKTPGKNPLWLDYFRITHSPSASTPTPSSSGLSTGSIVGIAVGGCAILVLLVTIVLLMRNLLRRFKPNVEVPPPYKNQEKTSWLQRLWTRLEPKPPGELHPFDPYARASQYSRSTTTNSSSFLYQSRSSGSIPGSPRPSSRGIDATYHPETTTRHLPRGHGPGDKRPPRSNLSNMLRAQSPLPR